MESSDSNSTMHKRDQIQRKMSKRLVNISGEDKIPAGYEQDNKEDGQGLQDSLEVKKQKNSEEGPSS